MLFVCFSNCTCITELEIFGLTTQAIFNHLQLCPCIAKLSHGYLEHADGNGDWVLTIFTALSNVSLHMHFKPII